MWKLFLPLALLAGCAAPTPEADTPPTSPALEAEPPVSADVSPFSGVYGYDGEIEGEGFTGADAVGMAFIGTWQSEEDPQAVLSIDFGGEGLEARFGYGDSLDAPEPLTFVDGCDSDAPAGADSGYFTIGSGDEVYCYEVLAMTNETLSVMYLPRGVIQSYRLKQY